MARTEIARWGNSLAVRLPREVAVKAKLAEGAAVELEVKGGDVVIRKTRKRYTLDELLKNATRDKQPDEIWDDGPRGRELI